MLFSKSWFIVGSEHDLWTEVCLSFAKANALFRNCLSLLINWQCGTHCSFLFLPALGFRLINRRKQASFRTLTLSAWIYISRTIKKNRMSACCSSSASTETSLGCSWDWGRPSVALSTELLEAKKATSLRRKVKTLCLFSGSGFVTGQLLRIC